MNIQEFTNGIDIMGAAGLMPDWEPEKAVVWFNLLRDLEYRIFEMAVKEICKSYTDFYPGTNIPGLIRKTANEIRTKEFQKANRIEQEKYFEQCRLEATTPDGNLLHDGKGLKKTEILDKAGLFLKTIS